MERKKVYLKLSSQVAVKAETDSRFKDYVMNSVKRFMKSDWGEGLSPDEIIDNDAAERNGGDILGYYTNKDNRRMELVIIFPRHRMFIEVLFTEELCRQTIPNKAIVYSVGGRLLN